MSYIMFKNGEKLYFETYGKSTNPAILYIHGAPGIGITDFAFFQGKKFSEKYFLVAMEQRGVWRSDEIRDYFSIDKIISGYEYLRKKLGLQTWSVITHCLGARIAVEYYKRYPKVFNKIIFENPILDSRTPFESMIKVQLKFLKVQNNIKYTEFLRGVQFIKSIDDLEDYAEKISRETKIVTNSLIMSKKTLQELKKISNNYDYRYFVNSRNTELKMCKYTALYSFKPSVNIEQKVLILRSLKDIVVCNATLKKLRAISKDCTTVDFFNSKHWIHIDEPEKFYKIIDNFLST